MRARKALSESAVTTRHPSPNTVRLDAATIDLIAHRVAELLTDAHTETDHTGALIDAAEVARRFGLARSTVYDHADALGAIRLGTGTRPRLRFNPERVAQALAAERHTEPEPQPVAPRPRRARQRDGFTPSGAPLLEIRGAA